MVCWWLGLISYYEGGGMYMIRDAISNNDLALGWCQCLLQVQFRFIFEKVLKVEVI